MARNTNVSGSPVTEKHNTDYYMAKIHMSGTRRSPCTEGRNYKFWSKNIDCIMCTIQ